MMLSSRGVYSCIQLDIITHPHYFQLDFLPSPNFFPFPFPFYFLFFFPFLSLLPSPLLIFIFPFSFPIVNIHINSPSFFLFFPFPLILSSPPSKFYPVFQFRPNILRGKCQIIYPCSIYDLPVLL